MFTRCILLSSLFLCIKIYSFGQQVSISSFSENVSDLSGRSYPRNDLNGEICALIKIVGNANLSSVSGNVIGDIEKKENESWVYVSAGTKSIILNIENALPLKVTFDDYDLSIFSSHTYELRFEYINEVESVRLSEIILIFPSDFSQINTSQKALLKNLILTFKDYFEYSDKSYISIDSYCNRFTGSATYHQVIRERRASVVCNYLITCGMNPSKIIMASHSDSFSPNRSLQDVVIVRLNGS